MAKTFYTDIDMSSVAQVINMPASTASGEAVEHDQLQTALSGKQNTLSIAAGSANYLTLSGDELSISNLAITDVTVDATHATLAAYVAANYTTGSEHQEGDTVILTAASPTEVYINNGGTANDATDFTVLSYSLDDAAIRALLSGGDGVTYNTSTGEIEATVDDSTIELDNTDGSGALRVKDGGITEAKLGSDVDAETFALDGGYVATDASGGPVYPAATDSVQTAIEKLDGTLRQNNSLNHSLFYKETGVALTAATPYTVTHGNAGNLVLVQVSDATTGEVVTVDVDLKTGTNGDCAITSDTNVTVDIICVG